MRVVTYTSSTSLPPTIFSEKTLLQNTQTQLSYTHVHFTNTTEINTNCDILAVNAAALSTEHLDIVKRRFRRTIIWSDDIVKSVLWFVEAFAKDPSRHYIVVSSNASVHVQERESSEVFLEDTVPVHAAKSSPGREYLDCKIKELQQEDRSIEKIFNRLSLMKGHQ